MYSDDFQLPPNYPYKTGTPKENEWFAAARTAPKRPAVYTVWAANRLLYVGTSVQPRHRLLYHNRMQEFIDNGVTHVSCIEIPNDLTRMWTEAYLIHTHKPPLNRMGKFGFIVLNRWEMPADRRYMLDEYQAKRQAQK